MSEVVVDTEYIAGLASMVREAADQAHAASKLTGAYSQSRSALQDVALAPAVDDFFEAWAYGLGILVKQAHRLADGLDLLVCLYGDIENSIAGELSARVSPGATP